MSFPDATHGWAIGSTACQTQPCPPIVLRTQDGGTTWRDIPAPPTTKKFQAYSGVAFEANLETGFAYGDELLAETQDGGATWTQPASVAGVTGAALSSVLTTPNGALAVLQPPASAKTAPQQLVTAPVGSTAFTATPGLPSGVELGDLSTAANVIYAVATTTATSSTATSLLQVKSGKVTTHRMPGTGNECATIAASTAEAVLVDCTAHGLGGGMGTRTLYGTTDGGASFKQLPSPGAGGGFDDAGLVDAGNSHAVLASESGAGAALTATSDGTTWRDVLTLPKQPSGAQLVSLGFADATHGFVIANTPTAKGSSYTSTLYRSTDAGQTWHPGKF